ncbi:ABC transporter permease [Salinicoccus halodurans]|uniref:Transport permease protein n=1 Tax=Salinicoccus halodurans TaxID=407035 RepID=A0A0F7D408_9STAP|nr:ABC transporter permease [Salinicoccus halodurans]AKG73410.1 teichoic acid ABC transporter permease [Salinicoccus halodurans]SFK81136.1 teichoic acid transport system permease protein [Salinicoccus halodurans]
MNNIFKILKEQWLHRRLIIGLSVYSLKSQYANHYLGLFWNILQPAMQVFLYYVVFGLGLRGDRGDVGDLPFIVHLISGLFPWLYISAGINAASGAIQSQIGLVTKMKFPSSTLISVSIVNSLINLFITTSILLVISIIYGFSSPIHYLSFLYFVVASVALISSVGLIMSTLVILIRDMKNVLQNVIRMFFFLTPIFWSLSEANALMHTISSFNPVAYLVMNYRTALVLQEAPLYGGMSDHIYFWSITLFLFYVGVNVHYRFRDRLVDYL